MKIFAKTGRLAALVAVAAAIIIASQLGFGGSKSERQATAGATRSAATGADVASEPASLTVTTDTVRRATIGAVIVANGVVTARREVIVGSAASGLRLVEVAVKQGDHVGADQILARLDDSLLRAQIAEQDAAIESAEAMLANAVSTSERSQRLMKSGTVSRETAESNATSVATARAALTQARAAKGTLQVQLDRTVIRAPFAGIVSARPAVPGIIVQSSSEIARIQEGGVLEARVDVPEQSVSSLSSGSAAVVTAPDGREIAARFTALDEVVDSETHLAMAVLALPEGSGLKAGMFVTARIETGGTDSLTVADKALTWQDGQTAVFRVAADDTVAAVPVTVGVRSDGRVAVSGQLVIGDRVVTSGAGFLQDGNKVRLVTQQATSDGDAR